MCWRCRGRVFFEEIEEEEEWGDNEENRIYGGINFSFFVWF